jgi:Glycosyltransferase family 87
VGKRGGADGSAVLSPPLKATSIVLGRDWGRPALRSAPSRSGSKLAAERLLLGFVPPALLVVLIAARYLVGRHLGFDYKPLWEASRQVWHGASPYPPPHAWALHDEQQFVYPPIAALLAAPLAILPFGVAAALLAVIELGATGLTLWVLRVRDWRCYSVTLLWYPVIENFLLGSITSLLALGLALAWRYRDERRIAPLAVAALVATKVFLWPVLVWQAATRRASAAARALAFALGAVLLSWALIGFAGFTSYPRLLDELSRLEQWKSYSGVAFGLALGLGSGEARALALAACALALLAAVLVARRGEERPAADRQAFVLALAAAFFFSPIVWTHYLALLVVPIALTRPTLSPLWFVPLAIWATPQQSDGDPWRVVLGFSVWVVVLATCLWSASTPAGASRRRGGWAKPFAGWRRELRAGESGV